MATCAVVNTEGDFSPDPQTPLDQCSYIVLDQADYLTFVEVPISELYALNLVGFAILTIALAIIAGRQFSW